MKIEKTLINTLLLLIFFSCQKENITSPESPLHEPIYFNSFESAMDTIGWQGYGSYNFFADAPPVGGTQSLNIFGGCIMPHAFVIFQNKSSSQYVKLHCWGKQIGIGGYVSLSKLNSLSQSIFCNITDTIWTYYESADSIYCSANDTLCLYFMGGGGRVKGAILIDMIEVKGFK